MKSNQPTSSDSRNATSSPALDSGVSPCNGPDSGHNPESGREVALVSRGAAQAQEKDTPTSATCGPLFETSYSQSDLPLFSESKSPVPQLSERLGEALKIRLSRFGSMEYGQTWKLRVTPSGLRYWAHTVCQRPTSGSGVTGSLTPSAGDAQRGVHPNPDKQAGSHSLNNEAAFAGYPTCRANGSTEDQEQLKARSRKNGTNLDAVTNLAGHPSPRAEDSEQTGAHRGNPDTLNSCSKLAGHPTCRARDWKDTPGMAQTGINPDGTTRSRLDTLPRVTTNNGIGNPERACDGKCRLEDQCLGANTGSTDTSTEKTAAYRLNPGFSLWLMIGIPGIVDAWASCGVRAMELCRRSRRSS